MSLHCDTPSAQVTNHYVINLIQTKKVTLAAREVLSKFSYVNLKEDAVRQSMYRLEKYHKKLQKDHNKSVESQRDYEIWLSSTYVPPQCIPPIDPNHNYASKSPEPSPTTDTATDKECDKLKRKLEESKREMKRVRSQKDYQRKKVESLKENLKSMSDTMIMDYEVAAGEDEVSFNMQRMKTLEEEKKFTDEKLQMLEDEILKLNNEEIETWDSEKNCYTNEFREVVYKLLQEHVSSKHVSSVIEIVMGFCRKSPTKLPSPATIDRMNIERLSISQTQLAEVLPDKTSTTLYSDETSKYGQKYMGYHLTDENQTHYVLGIRDLATKSANDTLSTFMEVIDDIRRQSRESDSDIGRKILCNIANTMSDRAATEKAWHTQLEKYIQEIQPQLQQLSPEDRRPVERLAGYYCGLHSFIQVAETSDAALSEIELRNPIDLSNGQLVQKTESGVVRLIRTAAKAFARAGDAKSGCFSDFKIFMNDTLKQFKMKSLPLVPFRGNRFNIIFFNGALVYFLRDYMVDFLEKRGDLNRLLNAVYGDLQIPQYVGGCKALGIINKLITGPLWRVIENRDVSITRMALIMREVIDSLENVSVPKFMEGEFEASTATEWYAKKDHIYEKLVAPGFDEEVVASLSVLVPAICKTLKDHYEPLLTGEIDPVKTKSVEKHNKFAERVFAYTDQLLRFKPNISHICQEAYIMFCLNRTAEWLANMNTSTKANIIEEARKSRKSLMLKYNQRREEINETRKKNLEEKIAKEKELRVKREASLQLIHDDIQYWGLYQTEDQMEKRLREVKGKGDKLDAIKAQLRFREKFLCQEVDKSLFRFSSGGKPLTVNELKDNVIKLITIARENRVNMNVQSRGNEVVGKTFVHKFGNETYRGSIISMVPGYPEWYNLEYEGDRFDGDVYVERLHDEIKKGNIIMEK